MRRGLRVLAAVLAAVRTAVLTALRAAVRTAVLASVLAAVLALGGCGGASLPENPGRAAPANRAAAAQSALAAQTTAQTEFGLLAGGDYGHAWDLWSDPAKQAISRKDFVTLNTACPVELGVPTRIVAARPVNDTTVAIDWERSAPAAQAASAESGTAQMVYAGGSWRFEPAASEYRDSLGALMARRRAAHQCRKAG